MPHGGRLRVAIAGAGMVTHYHLKAWSPIPGVEVVAIYNRHLDKAINRAKEFCIPKTYSDIILMLEKERPDALDIAVALEVSSEFAKMAAERGIHMLCQKPMAPSFQENAIAHFVEALRTGKPFETDCLDNLKTLRLVEDAYRFAAL